METFWSRDQLAFGVRTCIAPEENKMATKRSMVITCF